jgi:hypothetical protein
MGGQPPGVAITPSQARQKLAACGRLITRACCPLAVGSSEQKGVEEACDLSPYDSLVAPPPAGAAACQAASSAPRAEGSSRDPRAAASLGVPAAAMVMRQQGDWGDR